MVVILLNLLYTLEVLLTILVGCRLLRNWVIVLFPFIIERYVINPWKNVVLLQFCFDLFALNFILLKSKQEKVYFEKMDLVKICSSPLFCSITNPSWCSVCHSSLFTDIFFLQFDPIIWHNLAMKAPPAL